MNTRFIGLALLGLAGFGVATARTQELRTVRGRVFLAMDSLPLASVTIRVLGRPAWAQTRTDGRFILPGVPREVVSLVFARIGVVPDTVQLTPERNTVEVYLQSTPVVIDPVVAAAAPVARERFETAAQTSTVTLDPVEIAKAPSVLEPDVVKVVQLLPGTVAKNDYTTGLNVRGGESDQNLIRLDGVTVFNPFHLGGMFSTFDAAAVGRVDFITGGFPAEYGGRLSSVLDVELRSGTRRKTNLRGSISMLSAKLLVDGPLFGTGATYLVGARRTYADAFIDAVSDDPFTYYFGDAVAKATIPLWTGGTVSVTGYWGRDRLDLPWVEAEEGRDAIDLEFAWGNRLAGITLRQPLGTVEWEQYFSITKFSTSFALVPGDIIDAKNSVLLRSARSTFALSPGRTHDVRVGVSVDDYDVEYDFESKALSTQLIDLTYSPTTWSAFIDDQWRPTSWLLVRPGVRLEHVLGGADFTALSPRIAAKVFLSREWAITGSAGRYYQAIHSIRDQELPVTLFEFWIGADNVTPVARSDHLVLGFEHWFSNSMSLSVEGYTKSFDELALANFRDDPKVRGDEFIRGTGFSHGVDVLLRKYVGRITGWVAYTFNKTIRRTIADPEFAPAHDRRHTLDLVVQGPGPFGSTMGVRWGYGSPLPYTGIVGQWKHRDYNADLHAFDQADQESISTTINAERFPHYSRLDVSFRWEFEMWGGTWRPFLQLVNVYNRRNVWVYTFEFGRSPPIREGYSQLPILPTVGVEFEW